MTFTPPLTRQTFLALALALGAAGCAHQAASEDPAVAAPATFEWSSPESRARFSRAEVKGDFFQLASYFEPQATKFSCGPTTGTIVLNALLLKDSGAGKPTDRSAYPLTKNHVGKTFEPVFSKFTQNSFFDSKTDAVKTRDVFFGKAMADGRRDGGLQLGQLGRMLEIHGLAVSTHYADEPGAFPRFKTDFLDSLKDSTSFVVVNFDRRGLGQNGGGHISPVVAYDAQSDSFLVLDVNPVVTEWFWVKADTLFAAMNTKDTDRSRGYLIISRPSR